MGGLPGYRRCADPESLACLEVVVVVVVVVMVVVVIVVVVVVVVLVGGRVGCSGSVEEVPGWGCEHKVTWPCEVNRCTQRIMEL